MRARDLLVSAALGVLAGLAWPWWSDASAAWIEHLPRGLALLGSYVAFRVALSPARALVDAAAAATPKPSSRTHP